MIVIRSININDKEALEKFAFTTRLGVTSLIKDKVALFQKLQLSLDSFAKNVKAPGAEHYLFILEDMKSGEQGGTSGIWAKTGVKDPAYYFRVETLDRENQKIPFPSENRILHSISYKNGPTEICGLYLLPEYRHSGQGKLLSLSRFLFMASFPERFDNTIISNMRGVIDDEDHCPFWEGFGQHFLDISFRDIMYNLNKVRQYIPYFLPKYPVYASLFPKITQQAIGKTHPNTVPALRMLENEGFVANNEIDIFDGGPILTVQKSQIRTIKESLLGTFKAVEPKNAELSQYILCNNRIDFRACFGNVNNLDENNIKVSAEIAEALQINIGDTVRYVKIKGSS